MLRALALAAALTLAACGPQADAPGAVGAPAGAPSPRTPPAPGQTAPDFTLLDTEGTPRALSDFRGRIVVLEWADDACPYVRKHYSGSLQALQRGAAEDGVVWLSLIPAGRARDWKVRTGAAPTHLLPDPGGRLGQAYGVRTTPELRIIDRTGRLVFAGGVDDRPTTDPADLQGATNFVKNALDDLMSERPLRTTIAAPYGCALGAADASPPRPGVAAER
ncbi:redoxin domain-containing protein [Brevundimonas sp. FT23028]|uniref:redoxin domain-containing protein n=1 Tax=Brevundimonas sp. FT23028 TaxID=3393748 RepID=UPI003B58AB6C